MKARVNENCKYDTIRSAGFVFVKNEWRDFPAWAESEIGANEYLEIDPAPSEVEPDAQPATVEDKATKLVVVKPGRSRKARKL
jgi:hypothetical protein